MLGVIETLKAVKLCCEEDGRLLAFWYVELRNGPSMICQKMLACEAGHYVQVRLSYVEVCGFVEVVVFDFVIKSDSYHKIDHSGLC